MIAPATRKPMPETPGLQYVRIAILEIKIFLRYINGYIHKKSGANTYEYVGAKNQQAVCGDRGFIYYTSGDHAKSNLQPAIRAYYGESISSIIVFRKLLL
jgi:hypothetical protein